MTKIELSQLVLEAQNNKKYWSAKEKDLKDKLIQMSRCKPWENDQFKFACLERLGSINYKSLVSDHGIDTEPYRGDKVVMWKLTKKVTII